MANADRVTILPSFRVNVGKKVGLGPGKIALLEAIEKTGSIAEAARGMEMSYMRAWTMVKTMEKGFPEPLVLKKRGGLEQGGATLSPTGKKVVVLFRELEAKTETAIAKSVTQFEAVVKGA